MKHQRYPFLFLMLCFIPKVPFVYCAKNERKKFEEFFYVNEEIRCKSYGTRSDTRHVAIFTVSASTTRNPQSNEILIHYVSCSSPDEKNAGDIACTGIFLT